MAKVLASGGVDSTVCCALLYKALGKSKVHAIHIDTGFMRFNEGNLVKAALEKIGFALQIVDASEDFFNGTTTINGQHTLRLCETIDPEQKRKIIGDTFMKVIFKEIAKLKLSNFFLAQGTLRPDLIESASSIASAKADVIKTHHNDTPLVREKRAEGLIIEPLRDYHKDEVRQLGKKLGLPDELVYRQPFPGPGLAIRILCAENKFLEDHYDEVKSGVEKICGEWGVNGALLPIKSVGVQGDGRSYSYVVGVGMDGVTDWEKVIQLAKEIPKKVHKINRVVFSFGKDIEWGKEEIDLTRTFLTKSTVEILRKADEIVNFKLKTYKEGILLRKISQVPVVLIPVSWGEKNKWSIVIRTFITNDFMTGVPAIPGIDFPIDLLQEIVEDIRQMKEISHVFYDLTPKPPGTTEWE